MARDHLDNVGGTAFTVDNGTGLQVRTKLQKVIDALRCVHDPEIPNISVLDLGLIYELDVTEDGDVYIKHTLTSMMCPFADQICKDIEEAPKGVVGVRSVKRELVYNPPFTMDMVPEDTKIIMGWD